MTSIIFRIHENYLISEKDKQIACEDIAAMIRISEYRKRVDFSINDLSGNLENLFIWDNSILKASFWIEISSKLDIVKKANDE